MTVASTAASVALGLVAGACFVVILLALSASHSRIEVTHQDSKDGVSFIVAETGDDEPKLFLVEPHWRGGKAHTNRVRSILRPGAECVVLTIGWEVERPPLLPIIIDAQCRVEGDFNVR